MFSHYFFNQFTSQLLNFIGVFLPGRIPSHFTEHSTDLTQALVLSPDLRETGMDQNQTAEIQISFFVLFQTWHLHLRHGAYSSDLKNNFERTSDRCSRFLLCGRIMVLV